MNRGARRQAVFPDAASKQRFMELLAELPLRFGVRVHGFALMDNHFHLMLECPTGGLSEALQYLQSRYSRWLNNHHQWDGPVWRGRFRSRVVEDDEYWRYLLAYLHLNPVRGGLAANVDAALWTSHGAYAGSEPVPAFLTVDELQDAFGTAEAYRSFLDEQLQTEGGDREALAGAHLWGSSSEHAQVVAKSASRALSVEQAWSQLERVTGLERAALAAAQRGRRGNPARWVAVWWLQYATALSGAEAGAQVGASPSFTSRAVARVRQRPRDGGPDWALWADELSSWLVDRS